MISGRANLNGQVNIGPSCGPARSAPQAASSPNLGPHARRHAARPFGLWPYRTHRTGVRDIPQLVAHARHIADPIGLSISPWVPT